MPETSKPLNSSKNKQELAREIEKLLLCVKSLCEPAKTEASLAVVRLFKGMRSEDWKELSAKFGLSNWIPLDLEKNNYTQLEDLQEKLESLVHQSNHDPLTGLTNRRGFDQILHMEMERTKRYKNAMSLAVLDVDDFKQINDAYGHPCGDKVLQDLARLLKKNIRQMDHAARIGGEEFAIILGGSGLVRSRTVLERLQKDINSMSIRCPETEEMMSITCSFGLACFKGNVAVNAQELYQAADKALYEAKRAGKDTVHSAPLLGVMDVSDSTLVRKEEKQFLFSK